MERKRSNPWTTELANWRKKSKVQMANWRQKSEVQSQSHASEIICYDILSRLPAKSLMRFRCVCKSWSSLIHDPSFVAAYGNNKKKKKTTNLIYHHSDIGFFISQIDHKGHPRPLTAALTNVDPCKNSLIDAQSVNGLVCASSSHYIWAVVVFNPTTRECIKLAKPMVHLHSTYHFGFSPSTNEYKILQVHRNYRGARVPEIRFYIFTLGTKLLWRQLCLTLDDRLFHQLINCRFRRSLCLNGVIHWIHEDDNVLVVFDVGDEKWRAIPLPDSREIAPPLDRVQNVGMIEMEGCLAIYGVVHDSNWSKHLMLWILKDYQNHEWVKENILFDERDYLGDIRSVHPLGMTHTGELVVMVDYKDRRARLPTLRLYSMKRKAFITNDLVFPLLLEEYFRLLTIFEENIVPLS